MSIKVALMAEHSELIDDVVGAILYFSVTFFIAFAMFAERKTRDNAAGAIDRGSIVCREDDAAGAIDRGSIVRREDQTE